MRRFFSNFVPTRSHITFLFGTTSERSHVRAKWSQHVANSIDRPSRGFNFFYLFCFLVIFFRMYSVWCSIIGSRTLRVLNWVGEWNFCHQPRGGYSSFRMTHTTRWLDLTTNRMVLDGEKQFTQSRKKCNHNNKFIWQCSPRTKHFGKLYAGMMFEKRGTEKFRRWNV